MKMNNFFKKTRKDFDTETEWKIFNKLRAHYLELKEQQRQESVIHKYSDQQLEETE